MCKFSAVKEIGKDFSTAKNLTEWQGFIEKYKTYYEKKFNKNILENEFFLTQIFAVPKWQNANFFRDAVNIFLKLAPQWTDSEWFQKNIYNQYCPKIPEQIKDLETKKGNCKSCNAEIFFIQSAKNKEKFIPVDKQNILISEETKDILIVTKEGIVKKVKELEDSEKGYLSHFNTCTEPKLWKKKA